MKISITSFVVAFVVFTSSIASAATTVIGGAGILTQSGANQLATWLGEGDLTLTNIFSHITGDGKTSLDFHSAADGMGRTFSVLKVIDVSGTSTNIIVGGYNPQSWNSSNSTNLTPVLSDRTAFLFNLSAGTKNAQRLDNIGGQYQTHNFSASGPDFGGGNDLYVSGSLNSGFANAYSYSGQLIGTTRSPSLTYSHLDVFTIETVPEPTTCLLIAIGLAAKGFRRNRNDH